VLAFAGPLAEAARGSVDHKTALQENLQRQGRSVRYAVVSDIGPPHARVFTSAAIVGGQELGRGTGATKKASEQEAALAALAALTTTRDLPCT
jgi:ribonuclease-3